VTFLTDIEGMSAEKSEVDVEKAAAIVTTTPCELEVLVEARLCMWVSEYHSVDSHLVPPTCTI
jgi:hypothetical protein